MAAYMKHVYCLISFERKALLLAANTCRFNVESKRYIRGLRRKPVKILYPEDDRPKPIEQQPAPKQQHGTFTKDIEEKEFAKITKNLQTALKDSYVPLTKDSRSQKEIIAGLRIERAFPGDKRLSRAVSVARSRKFREQQGKILLEGRRLIIDALNAGANPQMVFFNTVDRLLELPVDKLKRATLVKVKFEDVKIWSDLVTPHGVIAIFSRPDSLRLQYNRDHSIPLSLICDNIRDPGNLGTMLRCAVAAGCQSVFLTKGCVDAWEPKVLRAAMGAHFRLPLFSNLHWDDIEHHLPQSVTVHVADHSGNKPKKTLEPEAEDLKISQKAKDYGWVRTRSKQVDYEDYEDYDSDSNSDNEYEVSLPRVDTRLYCEHWAENPTALVVGGETHGLSLESVQLAEKTAGKRLFIPVVPDVDSLNSAMAASILLFEGRKQLLQQHQSTKNLCHKNRVTNIVNGPQV